MNLENEIGGFLERNNFKKVSSKQWQNDFCVVAISDNCYIITHGYGDTVFSSDHNLYWLIGYLTYNEFLSREYVK